MLRLCATSKRRRNRTRNSEEEKRDVRFIGQVNQTYCVYIEDRADREK